MKIIAIEYGHSVFRLPLGETVLGRGAGCPVRFTDPAISRRHLRFFVSPDDVLVEDLGSANGTRVNGERLASKRQLAHGDLVELGSSRLRVTVRPELQLSPRDTIERLPHYEDLTEVPRAKSTSADERWIEPPTLVGNEIIGGKPLDEQSAELYAERRQHQRIPAELSLCYDSDTFSLECIARNLSDGGLFIATEFLDLVGTSCALTMSVDGEISLRAEGVVRHVVTDPERDAGLGCGMGIEFTSLPATLRNQVNQLIGSSSAA